MFTLPHYFLSSPVPPFFVCFFFLLPLRYFLYISLFIIIHLSSRSRTYTFSFHIRVRFRIAFLSFLIAPFCLFSLRDKDIYRSEFQFSILRTIAELCWLVCYLFLFVFSRPHTHSPSHIHTSIPTRTHTQIILTRHLSRILFSLLSLMHSRSLLLQGILTTI